jgi:hypothetical protein
MTTHEREITDSVELCSPNGVTLNPLAKGWSRFPLHRDNLGEYQQRNKRWDYWAVLCPDFTISSVFADIDVFGLADVYWADFRSGESGGQAILVASDDSFSLPPLVGGAPLRVTHDGFSLSIHDDDDGTHFAITWREPDGREGELVMRVDNPVGHESLNVVIPWDDEVFNFTSKQQARAAHGFRRVGEETWHFGGDSGIEAWGVLDVGRGRWPKKLTWNWGGGAGRAGDHVIGLQFGAQWTEGSGFTENGLIVDGRLHKIGRELELTYDWDAPMEPWRVVDPGGQLDLVMTPVFDKYTHTDVSEDLGSEVHQVFGRFNGFLVTDEGERIEFSDICGFIEEARQRW